MDNKKLAAVFDFLCQNRKYNKAVQQAFYSDVIVSKNSTEDKVVWLLHHVVNTQPQPKIDQLSVFFKFIHEHRSELASFNTFLRMLAGDKKEVKRSYQEVFENLRNKPGWGDKTAALFVKSIFHLHNKEYGDELLIWIDAPSKIGNEEHFYLPVDAVIQFIFHKLEIPARTDFKGINSFLNRLGLYKAELMEIWDDLWFWGFITQKGSGSDRVLEWNENKYWAYLHTSKNKEDIEVIQEKARIFIRLIS